MGNQKQPIPYEINPFFDIPEGVVDLVYEGDDYLDSDDSQDGEGLEGEEAGEADDSPDVPLYFTVLEQKVRYGPDGSQIVDLIIEVEEVEEIAKYDVRVTKA